MRASSREEAEISGAAEVENHPCLSGFLLPNLPFTQTNKNLFFNAVVHAFIAAVKPLFFIEVNVKNICSFNHENRPFKILE